MIEMALSHVNDPDLGRSLTELGMIENIAIDGNKVSFDLVLTTPACPMKQRMTDDCINAIHEYVDENAEVTVNLTSRQQEQPDPHDLVPGVKNVIVVASGKGGVGKSTVAVNLAISLAKTGASVGLIDADIYGPSVPIMFNLGQEDVIGQEHDGKTYMLPIERYGVKLMSIGFLVDPDRALAWRGPMASGALKQLATDTWWGEIDYLVRHLNFLVKTTFFGQVANVGDVFILKWSSINHHCATVGTCDTVDDAYERSLASAIRSQQAIDASLRHMQVDMVECHVPVILLHNTVNVNKIHNNCIVIVATKIVIFRQRRV